MPSRTLDPALAAPLGALLGVLLGCGGGGATPTFRALFPDNRAGDVAKVVGRLPPPNEAPENRTGRPLVVGASATHVFAYDLEAGRMLWKKAHVARSRPVVTPRVILILEDEDIIALDVENGRALWNEPVEENFLGATGDAARVYLAFGTAVAPTAPITERRACALLALSARTGEPVWRLETDRQFGTPASVGDVVFLPWDRQYLSALQASTGEELARIRMKDDSILFVTSWGGAVYYGSRGIYRLSAASTSGTQEGSVYLPPPTTELPGDPRSWTDGFVPPLDEAAAEHIRLYLRPGGEGDEIEVADGTVYYLFFKYLFGLAPADGHVRWASRLEHDPLAAIPVEGGLLVATKGGDLLLLDAEKGLVRWRAEIGVSDLASVAFDAGAFHPEGTLDPSERPLREALLDIANDRDNRLVPARAFAAESLGQIPGAEVTGDLVTIVSRRDVPQAIRDAAGGALLGRRAGAAKVLEALAGRHDYLEGTRAPPVAPLAKALASIQHARAVPQLLAHLDDPATDREALPEIIEALGEIGDRRAIAPLRAFLVRYHADEVLGARPAATKAAVDVLVALGRRPQRRALAELADDPHTLPDVRRHIRTALEPPTPEPQEEPSAAPEPPAAARGPSATESEVSHDYDLPVRLGPREIQTTMNKAAPRMRRCFRRGDPNRIRLVFVLRNDGGVDRLAIQPGEERLRACIETKVQRIRFGRFRESRQQITYPLDRVARPPTKQPSKRPTKR